MKTRTEKILEIMKFLAWIVFIGLLIQAGTLIFAFMYSLLNPGSELSFAKSIDWIELNNQSKYLFFFVNLLKLVIICLEAYTAMIATKILSDMNINNPFTLPVAKGLEKISFLILDIWIIKIIINFCSEIINNNLSIGITTDDLSFILLAGVIFIFAQIFKRGIELQNENDMTI